MYAKAPIEMINSAVIGQMFSNQSKDLKKKAYIRMPAQRSKKVAAIKGVKVCASGRPVQL